MTILQKLQLRQSEIRQAINTLLGNDARTDEQQGELEKLTGEGQGLEVELRAALIAEPDPNETRVSGDAADVELRTDHDASPGRFSPPSIRAGTPTGAKRNYRSTSRSQATNSRTPCSKPAHRPKRRQTWRRNRPKSSSRFSGRPARRS